MYSSHLDLRIHQRGTQWVTSFHPTPSLYGGGQHGAIFCMPISKGSLVHSHQSHPTSLAGVQDRFGSLRSSTCIHELELFSAISLAVPSFQGETSFLLAARERLVSPQGFIQVVQFWESHTFFSPSTFNPSRDKNKTTIPWLIHESVWKLQNSCCLAVCVREDPEIQWSPMGVVLHMGDMFAISLFRYHWVYLKHCAIDCFVSEVRD